MYSINIDKLVDMTSKEKKSFVKIANTLVDTLSDCLVWPDRQEQRPDEKCSIAVIGDAIDTFKLAAVFSQKGKRVLFVDGNIESAYFLGKYKLGKELEGFVECVMSKLNKEALKKQICITNRGKLDVLFSGSIDRGATTVHGVFAAGEDYIYTMFSELLESYDMIICHSDDAGKAAAYCDATVCIVKESEYVEAEVLKHQAQLEENDCNVLGVILDKED